MLEVEFRRAGLDNAAIFSTVHGRCLSPAWDVETFRTFLGQKTGLGVLATIASGAQPVGFCLGRLTADEAEILAIGVLADWRRQGLANRLMRAFHEHVKAGGGESVFLEVAHDNKAAIALYSSLGYVELARRHGYYAATANAPACDALVLRLQISHMPDRAPASPQKR